MRKVDVLKETYTALHVSFSHWNATWLCFSHCNGRGCSTYICALVSGDINLFRVFTFLMLWAGRPMSHGATSTLVIAVKLALPCHWRKNTDDYIYVLWLSHSQLHLFDSLESLMDIFCCVVHTWWYEGRGSPDTAQRLSHWFLRSHLFKVFTLYCSLALAYAQHKES